MNNKYIEKVEEYKQKTLEKALEKIKSEYGQAKEFYTDTGYDRYYKKMCKCEKQIEEIEEYLGTKQEQSIETVANNYKELLFLREKMKNIKSTVFYLAKDLPMCTDLINLLDMLRDY